MQKPIISVVGHVDVGKTSFLDYFASTKMKEVNNITQEIRIIEYSSDEIKKKVYNENSNEVFDKNFTMDGLIFIDTPGHDYFVSQRELTTKISHLAILIIDIVHGLNPTHIELIKHFKSNRIDFIIALNKIDTIYQWKPKERSFLKNSFQSQNKDVMKRLNDYMNNIICKLAEQEINAAPYYSNSDYKTFTSIIPISARTGEGMMDILLLISKLMQKKYSKLKSNSSYNNINGYIVDLSTGLYGKGYKYIHINKENILKTNDNIHFLNHTKINFQIKHILQNSIKVNQTDSHCVYNLILDNMNLDCGKNSIISIIDTKQNMDLSSIIECNLLSMDSVADNLNYDELINKIDINVETFDLDKYGIGIVTNSKSMENPLIYMFKQINIPISLITSDKLSKNHIIKVANNNKTKDRLLNILYNKFRVIIIFNPTYSIDSDKMISDEIQLFANNSDIKFIHDKTIYKLKEKYQNYLKEIDSNIKNDYGHLANINLEILPQFIFTKTSPLIFGVKVKKGILKKGIIISAEKNNKVIILGMVKSIQLDKNEIESAKVSDKVCIRVEHIDKKVIYGVDFDETFEVKTYLDSENLKIYMRLKDSIESVN